MKTSFYYGLLLIIPFFQSCGTTTTTTSSSSPTKSETPTEIHPHYTTTEKIANLKPGMDKNEVVRQLDVPIHDVYHLSQKTTLLQFFYVRPFRELKSTTNPMDNPTKGKTKYRSPQKVYVAFENEKMKGLITPSGRSSSFDIIVDQKKLDRLSESGKLLEILKELSSISTSNGSDSGGGNSSSGDKSQQSTTGQQNNDEKSSKPKSPLDMLMGN